MKQITLFSLLLTLILFVGCEDSKEDTSIDQDLIGTWELTQITWDIKTNNQSFTNELIEELDFSMKNLYIEYIFEADGKITELSTGAMLYNAEAKSSQAMTAQAQTAQALLTPIMWPRLTEAEADQVSKGIYWANNGRLTTKDEEGRNQIDYKIINNTLLLSQDGTAAARAELPKGSPVKIERFALKMEFARK